MKLKHYFFVALGIFLVIAFTAFFAALDVFMRVFAWILTWGIRAVFFVGVVWLIIYVVLKLKGKKDTGGAK